MSKEHIVQSVLPRMQSAQLWTMDDMIRKCGLFSKALDPSYWDNSNFLMQEMHPNFTCPVEEGGLGGNRPLDAAEFAEWLVATVKTMPWPNAAAEVNEAAAAPGTPATGELEPAGAGASNDSAIVID